MMKSLLHIDRFNAAGLLAILGCLMLGGALAFQYLGGLEPCALCIEQRKAWGAAVLLASVALLADRQSQGVLALATLGLAAVAALVGAGFAAFHVGVEQHWWTGAAACGAGFENFSQGGLADMRERLLARPVVRCDEIAWSFLWISMAGWNGLIALAASVGTLYVVIRDVRGLRKP